MKKHIIICGLPGTGKTTLCKSLAQELGMGYINDYEIFENLGVKLLCADRKKLSRKHSKQLASFLNEVQHDFVVDLDYTILPREARNNNVNNIYYLGFCDINKGELFEAFRQKDKQTSDKDLLRKIIYYLKVSSYCKKECQKYGYGFTGITKDREKNIADLKLQIINNYKKRK